MVDRTPPSSGQTARTAPIQGKNTETKHLTMGKVSVNKIQGGLAGGKISPQSTTSKKTFTASPSLDSRSNVKAVFAKCLQEIKNLKK